MTDQEVIKLLAIVIDKLDAMAKNEDETADQQPSYSTLRYQFHSGRADGLRTAVEVIQFMQQSIEEFPGK